MLAFRQYKKMYGNKLIVAAENLALDAPCYWLKGGNGSGKSTLLQSVAGIIPFSGIIEVAGHNTRRQQRAYRLAVNHAAAEPLYPDFLTGDDLIRFYTEAKGGTAAQAAALTAQFGIQAYASDKIGTYSSGMKKKLSLVLAFIGQPKLILLDEPLITLDAEAVSILLATMEDCLRAGTQLLITSHQAMPLTGVQPQQLMIVNQQLSIV